MINVIFIIFILFNDLYSQEIYVDYLIADNDTVDVFSYQIPNAQPTTDKFWNHWNVSFYLTYEN